MASITFISVALLNRTSSTTSELFQRINKAQLQVNAGNVFYANYGYLREKFSQDSWLNLTRDSFYISRNTTPTSLEEFYTLFESDILENRAWRELFARLSNDTFFEPGTDLIAVFNKLTNGTFSDLVLIPDRASPNTLLAVAVTNNESKKAYFWGLISPRYFSNWSRFELESNSTASWNPGSVIYGPTFFGSTGQGGGGNGGFRMVATVPPDLNNLSGSGPIFKGEVWYENWNLSLTGDWDGQRTIKVDTDGDGDYDKTYNNKNYAIRVENGEVWIYLEGFNEVIIASQNQVVSGELRVTGSVEKFVDNSASGNFNDRFIPWYLQAGSRQVDQATIADLETRFEEMETYYSDHYSNTTSLEDLLNTLENGVPLPQNTFGAYLKDTERSIDAQVNESQTTQLLSEEDDTWLRNLIKNDGVFLNAFKDWIKSDSDRKISANDILGNRNDMTKEEFNELELKTLIDNRDHVRFNGTVNPAIEERKTITQLETTGAYSIKDKANSVSLAADVLSGQTLYNTLNTGAFDNGVSYSVIKYKWDRDILASSQQTRQRTRTLRRNPVEYQIGPLSFTLHFEGWQWSLRKGSLSKGVPKSWNKPSTINGPAGVSSWSDWVYSDWSDWALVSGGGWGGNQMIAQADVELYFITPSNSFSQMAFDSMAVLKVSSDNEEDYPSFITTPATFTNRGYFVVEENIEIGGAAIDGGVGKSLGRDATVIDGRYTIRSKEGDISLYGDILYNDMLSDSAFRNYVNTAGLPFDSTYDPNTATGGLNDMLNLVATDGNIIMPYQSSVEGRNKIKNIKLFSNLFAFSGGGNTGKIIIEDYDSYNINMGYRHSFGTMVSIETSAAGQGGNGFRSRNYYDERLYGNKDMPFGSPESNLLETMGISMK